MREGDEKEWDERLRERIGKGGTGSGRGEGKRERRKVRREEEGDGEASKDLRGGRRGKKIGSRERKG